MRLWAQCSVHKTFDSVWTNNDKESFVRYPSWDFRLGMPGVKPRLLRSLSDWTLLDWRFCSVGEEVHRLETVYDVTYALSIHHWIELHITTFISITSIIPSTEMSIQTLTWLCLCGRFQTLLKSCSRNQKCVFKLRVGIYASWTHRAEDNVSIRVKHRLCLAAVFFRDKLLRVVIHFY